MLKTKIQEKFEKIWSQFVEEVALFVGGDLSLLQFWLPEGPM